MYHLPEINVMVREQNRATRAAVETIKSQRVIDITNAAACYTAGNLVYEKYTAYKPNRLPTEFEHDSKTHKRYLPDKVLDFFNDEFDYRELANWQDLQNLAMVYFILVASPCEVTSGSGGGGLRFDFKWGRNPEEDEIEFARRCALAASNKIGRHPKGGIKRK